MNERRVAGVVVLLLAALLLSSGAATRDWFSVTLKTYRGHKAKVDFGLRAADCSGAICAKASDSYNWSKAKGSKQKMWLLSGAATFWGGLFAAFLFTVGAIQLGRGVRSATQWLNGALVLAGLIFFTAFIFIAIPAKFPGYSAFLFLTGIVAGFVGARIGYRGLTEIQATEMHALVHQSDGALLNDMFGEPKPAAAAPAPEPEPGPEAGAPR